MAFVEQLLSTGLRYHQSGRLADAEALYRQVLQSDPNQPDALRLLGTIAHQVGRHGEAVELLQRSLRSPSPAARQSLNNLGEALRAMGQIDASVAAFRSAIQTDPGYAKAHSNLLLTLHSDPAMDGPALRAEHGAWARRHAAAAPVPALHANDRDPDRRLKVGYVSPDFRTHSVGYFIEPLLEKHDRDAVEVHCYSNDPRHDDVTNRLMRHARAWREIAGVSDDDAAEMIRRDAIDILVDLTGHMAKNRLLVFARKPAPVQVTYLGYPNGTGLPQMDYRLSDENADPAGLTDSHTIEATVRLPGSAWCYRPPPGAPECRADADAAAADRPVTFASFNKFPKISRAVAGLWAQILAAVPNSRLLIKAKSLGDPATREVALRLFADAGIPSDRLHLSAWQGPIDAHLAMYNGVDIALDTFPYHGTTTTCEALWMGVPVVTLAGDKHVSRVGVSLLCSVGLHDQIATTPRQYVQLAIDLARDAERRRQLRSELRERMRRSALTDARALARSVEAAYRSIWRRFALSSG